MAQKLQKTDLEIAANGNEPSGTTSSILNEKTLESYVNKDLMKTKLQEKTSIVEHEMQGRLIQILHK